ncbi:MAG: hypothetical protein WC291_05860 [Thermodesulfovibrionales bacterium]
MGELDHPQVKDSFFFEVFHRRESSQGTPHMRFFPVYDTIPPEGEKTGREGFPGLFCEILLDKDGGLW